MGRPPLMRKLVKMVVVSHWSVHKEECERLEEQMERANLLKEFPFTFSREATVEVCEKRETRCSFLAKRGVHQVGMWMFECSCGASVDSGLSRLIESWNLSSICCPCRGPSSSTPKHLASWKEYYEWRCIPFYSPVALLLHWPLTLYHAIRLVAARNLIPEFSNELYIHYLGPDKELSQLAVFGELKSLFPGLQVHVELVGPAIPGSRDGERIDLHGYAHCIETDCVCQSASENQSLLASGKSSVVRLRLHSGCYHDRYRDITKESLPHLVIAPNAGVAAFMSWLPTIELIKAINVPAVFSDYCEEAAHLAARCISSVTNCPPSIPVHSAKSIQAANGGGGQCFVSSLLFKLLSLWDVNWHSPRVRIYLNEDFKVSRINRAGEMHCAHFGSGIGVFFISLYPESSGWEWMGACSKLI
ncbi:hypothetical protein RHMOL_Rhmol12G0057500 [Rhododendron molle]|uniref:Uncharacterized protein n=1 Tax=Rhododendron molle TaxID=49168 RepID=A0ACC0LGC7_RHOML|nr:hypothetical protein RHMOL_Rhmol12G0057500 [Rhododendron molle]